MKLTKKERESFNWILDELIHAITEQDTTPKAIIERIVKQVETLLEKRQQETSRFLHNVLHGIDIADRVTGGGGTKALRLALMSRGLLLPKEQSNYVDSLTPEERKEQAELQRTAIHTSASTPSQKGCCEKCIVRETALGWTELKCNNSKCPCHKSLIDSK